MIAARPTANIQGSVKAIWESLDMIMSGALQVGLACAQTGNPIVTTQADRATSGRPAWHVR